MYICILWCCIVKTIRLVKRIKNMWNSWVRIRKTMWWNVELLIHYSFAHYMFNISWMKARLLRGNYCMSFSTIPYLLLSKAFQVGNKRSTPFFSIICAKYNGNWKYGAKKLSTRNMDCQILQKKRELHITC